MFEERADQFGIVGDYGELRGHARLQLLTLLQRPARIARALGVAPYEFIQIQFGRIARQKVQCQPPMSGSDVGLHDFRLVGGQAVQHQVERLLAPMHQFLEQFHKRPALESTWVRGKPECPLDTDRQGGTDALALTRNVH